MKVRGEFEMACKSRGCPLDMAHGFLAARRVAPASFHFYVPQNNLAYVATTHLDGPTYQIICQSKILITALLSVAILGKTLVNRQWVSLGALTLGVGLVQLAGSEASREVSGEETQLGAVLAETYAAACRMGRANEL